MRINSGVNPVELPGIASERVCIKLGVGLPTPISAVDIEHIQGKQVHNTPTLSVLVLTGQKYYLYMGTWRAQ